MTETRYASLSGNLLARKGGARPAMRPRHIHSGAMADDLGWDDMGHGVDEGEHVPSSIAALTPAPRPVRGEIAPAAEVTPFGDDPAPVPVIEQQRALAARFAQAEAAGDAEDEAAVEAGSGAETEAESEADETQALPQRRQAEVVVMPRRPAADQGRKAAFTLRLDPARHLRLRLATAVTGRSAQNIVTAALDQFIETLPEVGTLAEQLPSRSKRS